MQRLIARVLLLFALAGNVIPLALAATATPPHACCLRKTHQCHGTASAESQERAVRATGSCSHDCCRGVTTSRWANPQPWSSPEAAQRIDAGLSDAHPRAPAAILLASLSTRAPPAR